MVPAVGKPAGSPIAVAVVRIDEVRLPPAPERPTDPAHILNPGRNFLCCGYQITHRHGRSTGYGGESEGDTENRRTQKSAHVQLLLLALVCDEGLPTRWMNDVQSHLSGS